MLEQARMSLVAFLGDSDQRVFVLKGPWGIGKSFFVRQFLLNNRDELPPFVSYTSVFGLRNIREVREVMLGCIQPTRYSWIGTLWRWISSFFSKFHISGWGVSLNVPNVSNSAFWALAKKHGILVVFDDLERAHEDLAPEEMLGLASSLTENSKAKVLLVFNADKLASNASKALATYREKVIDTELEFKPSTDELVKAFLGEPDLEPIVCDCLEISGGANIRLILRIKRALSYFRQALTKDGFQITLQDASQIARLVWLYHVSPTQLTLEKLKHVAVHRYLDESARKTATAEDRRTGDLYTRGGVRFTDLDELILSYLECGYLAPESLKRFRAQIESTIARADYQRRDREAYDPYTANFRATAEQVTAPAEKFLDEYADKIDLGSLRRHCEFLEAFGVSTAKWFCQHVTTVVGELDAEACKQYLSVIHDPVVRTLLERRAAVLKDEFDPKKTIERIVRSRSWHEDDLSALNSMPDSYYIDWFRTDAGELLSPLRSFLSICNAFPQAGTGGELKQKLIRVLREIAKDNLANEIRVSKFLQIPLSDGQEKSD
jgi:hypothetical protein